MIFDTTKDLILAFFMLGFIEAVVKPVAIAVYQRPMNAIKPHLSNIYTIFDSYLSSNIIENDSQVTPVLASIIKESLDISDNTAASIAEELLKPKYEDIGFNVKAFVKHNRSGVDSNATVSDLNIFNKPLVINDEFDSDFEDFDTRNRL